MPPETDPVSTEETQETTPVEETKVETPTEETSESPNGEDKPSDWPDEVPKDKEGKRPSDTTLNFEDLPEDIRSQWEQRFKSLYKQTKAQDRYLDQLGKDFQDVTNTLDKLSSQESTKNKNIENLTSVVAELTTKDASASKQLQMNQLQESLAKAHQDMDFDRIAELQIQVAQAAAQPAQKVELPEFTKEEKIEVKTETQETTQEENINTLTPREQSYLQEWMNEIGDGGQLVRPWAQRNHPMFDYALQQTAAMLQHPSLKGQNIDAVLSTVDNIMSTQLNPVAEVEKTQEAPKPSSPQPLASDANIRTSKTKDKTVLNEDQKRVAIRMFPKLGQSEAIDKYKNAYEKTQKLTKE